MQPNNNDIRELLDYIKLSIPHWRDNPEMCSWAKRMYFWIQNTWEERELDSIIQSIDDDELDDSELTEAVNEETPF